MSESEKITINLGAMDLGKIDLLVHEGMYGNRTDFIRTAIRSQIDKHGVEVQQSVARYAFLIGVLRYGRKDLERLKAKGKRVKLTVIGSLTLAGDVPADLAAQVIERVQVRGLFNASAAVKTALADRMH
ncbi:MAG: CopG family transcriptional regulator [Candidatus Eisenbacteria bacterium]|nr:CopG family transcriptional regulator [Candidatus Eisenbacteria bacterium]